MPLHQAGQWLYRVTYQQRFQRWLNRRVPPSDTIRLSHRTLFIFPTRMGWFYLGLCTVLYLLGSNFQNNLVVGLAYLLISLFVISIVHCHQNLSGCLLKGLPTEDVHAQTPLRFYLSIQTGKRARYDLQLSAKHGLSEHLPHCFGEQMLGITFIPRHRGLFQAPRFRLSSEWPLGLLRCWTWIDLKQHAWVYPEPIACAMLDPSDIDQTTPENRPTITTQLHAEEIEGLKPYRQGESNSRISWRHVLQGRGWFSKSFAAHATLTHHLMLDPTLTGNACEQALSELCYQALELYRRQQSFSLQLGSVTFPAGAGSFHLQQCLLAMARYDVS